MRLGRHRNAIRAYEQGREPIPPAIAYATAWLLLHGDADPFAGHEAPADDIAAE